MSNISTKLGLLTGQKQAYQEDDGERKRKSRWPAVAGGVLGAGAGSLALYYALKKMNGGSPATQSPTAQLGEAGRSVVRSLGKANPVPAIGESLGPAKTPLSIMLKSLTR